MTHKIGYIALIFIITALFSGQSLFARDYLDKIKERGIDASDSTGKPASEYDIVKRPSVQYTAEALRDPFRGYRPVVEDYTVDTTEEIVSTEPPQLSIQGIVWGNNNPQAIIENKVVKIGDTINEATILDISKDGIAVLYKNRKYNINPSRYISSSKGG